MNENQTNITDAYELARQFALSTNRCLFITGKAGTGKTTFLRRLQEQTDKNMVVVAPTGVAAINAGGVTIHSLFQLPLRTLFPTQQSYKQMFAEQRMTQHKRNLLYNLELLVIDEISMVRADVLDAIDAVLRRYRYKRNQPFGGVQVIMIGDLFQLSPVVQAEEQMNLSKHYEGPYFFQSKVMQQITPLYIELDHVFRQQNQQFVSLLNEVRENKLTNTGREMLRSRYIPDFKNTDSDFHITLTTHNNIADEQNKNELEKLSGKEYVFKAIIKDNFPENIYPTEKQLTLKVGTRVMFIRNSDSSAQKKYFNGKQGIVKAINGKTVNVYCEDDDDIIEVEPITWENIRYTEDEQTGKITEELLGTFTQIPLRLAWAITIHKSQGLTFDKVIIDAARSFAAGQVYVALSRCRTLEGIVLSSPLSYVRLSNDNAVIQYTHSQPKIQDVSPELLQAQTEYLANIYTELFDLSRPFSQVEQLMLVVNKSVSFNPETQSFIDSLNAQTTELLPIAEKFERQLLVIIFSNDQDKLQERIKAAANYFIPKFKLITQAISTHPCRSSNRDDAAEFMGILSNLFLNLHRKIHILSAVAEDCSISNFITAKQSFKVPQMKVTDILIRHYDEYDFDEYDDALEALDYYDFDIDSIIDDDCVHPSFKKMVKQTDYKTQQRKEHKNAYSPWTIEDDMRLADEFQQGKTIKELMKIFQRNEGAIYSRLKKLKLK